MNESFLNVWYDNLRNCNYENTYKMAWAKAIVEIALEADYNKSGLYEIHLEEIAGKIIKYYWNQTIFFHLVQGSNPLKPPKILSITKDLIGKYQTETLNFQPCRFEKIQYLFMKQDTLSKYYRQTIKKIVTVLKKDVSYRFLNIGGRKSHILYLYEQGENSLLIKKEDLRSLKDHAQSIFDTINYRWSLILETFNSTPRIGKKVKIIDDLEIRRRPLNIYMQYLDADNPGHHCFICNKKISNSYLAIDHVIPWSFLYSDDLWNLVYTHQSCNSIKSNAIPSEGAIVKLEERNRRLLKLLDGNFSNKVVEELRLAVENNFERKFWIACQ